MIPVIVKFDPRVPGRIRGAALMAFERDLRERGIKANVFLERRPDDLKSRAAMTPDERAKL